MFEMKISNLKKVEEKKVDKNNMKHMKTGILINMDIYILWYY